VSQRHILIAADGNPAAIRGWHAAYEGKGVKSNGNKEKGNKEKGNKKSVLFEEEVVCKRSPIA
jgi:hypothetical protein